VATLWQGRGVLGPVGRTAREEIEGMKKKRNGGWEGNDEFVDSPLLKVCKPK